jgi:putative zinc finger/helix-turn-helix YgiT family protein
MPELCVKCANNTLHPKTVEFEGTVREEKYAVSMPGFECSTCGYKTMKGPYMAEFGRLLADKYRANHGLLTSDQIKERRLQLGLSQQAFADYLKRGVASVKRWEMGKIQEPDNDRHIREMTETGPVTTQAYMYAFSIPNMGGTTTAAMGTINFSTGGSKKQSQGWSSGSPSEHATSTSDIKTSSSHDSTLSFGRGTGRPAHA